MSVLIVKSKDRLQELRVGISKKAVADAAKRAAEALRKAGKGGVARGTGPLESGALAESMSKEKKGKGQLVAFYAAQPFEETYETIRPDDAEDSPENYYGLLSSAIVKVLSQSPVAGERRRRGASIAVIEAACHTPNEAPRGVTPGGQPGPAHDQ